MDQQYGVVCKTTFRRGGEERSAQSASLAAPQYWSGKLFYGGTTFEINGPKTGSRREVERCRLSTSAVDAVDP